jgi:ABC-type glycerol-3-phosphate transport system substrate-binding protein
VKVIPYDPRKGSPAPGVADIWVIRPAELPRWASAGLLAPVPAELRQSDSSYEWMSLLPMYREQLLVWDRVAYGLPLLGEASLCCYRADLFADLRHQKGFQTFLAEIRKKSPGQTYRLEAPATWEAFATIAEYFRLHGHPGKQVPSLPPLPADEERLDRLFYFVAGPHARRAVREEDVVADQLDDVFSFHYDLKTGMPRIGTPAFVHALRLLQRMQACRIDTPAGAAAGLAPEEAFRNGQAVLCVTDASWLVKFQKTAALRDRFGICPIPGADRTFSFNGQERMLKDQSNRMPYLGSDGWVAVVPRTSGNSAAAFDFLASLSGPAISAQMAQEPRWGGGPIRLEQLSRERWDSFDLDEKRSGVLREVVGQTLQHYGLKNPILCLRTPDESAHRTALVEELRAALSKGGDPARALTRVARRWEEIASKMGKEAHKSAYRLSLGLLPQ